MAIPPASRMIRDVLDVLGIEPGTLASDAMARALAIRDEQWRAEVESLGKRKRWAVRFSNYEPAEIASLHDSEEEARAECDRLNREGDTSMWEVEGGW